MKKVLIVAYYWPPAGGPGVQRWLKFVKYLPEFGIQPIVYIPENPTYPIIDADLLNEVPPQAIILRKKIFEPYGMASFFSKDSIKKISSGIIPAQRKQTFAERLSIWIRGNIFIPDARVLWVKPSVSFLEKYIRENNIDTLITTGPPHSLHLIGLKLKEKLNIRWLADFRDPWTTIGYHKSLKLSTFAENRHKHLEGKVLNAADHIIVTSKTTQSEFTEITSKPIDVLTNGYDIEFKGDVTLDEKFSLAHIGSLLAGRNPQILWEVLSELIKEVPDFAAHLQIKLIGAVSQEIITSVTNYNLLDHTQIMGYISHSDAVMQQRQSQMLLLIEIDSEDTKSIIPGKLFEYMVSGRPIIAIGPKGSDFAEIITNTNTGTFFNYTEKEKLKQTILSDYHTFLEGKLKVNAAGLEQYSRRKLTERLAALLQ